MKNRLVCMLSLGVAFSAVFLPSYAMAAGTAGDVDAAVPLNVDAVVADHDNNDFSAPDSPSFQPQDNMAGSKLNPAAERALNEFYKYEGLPVKKISVAGNTKSLINEMEENLTIKQGQAFSVHDLALNYDRLVEAGWFAEVMPSVFPDGTGVAVSFAVKENPLLAGVEFRGNTMENSARLAKCFEGQEGKIANRKSLQSGILAVQDAYAQDGFTLARVSSMEFDENGKAIFTLDEGILEDYAVSGNDHTRDYVIIREMRQKKGTPYNAFLAQQSLQRVMNLGFFSNVSMKMKPGSYDGAWIMEVEVSEKRTGSVGIGASTSSSSDFGFSLGISESNLFGTGDSLSLRYGISADDKDAHGFLATYVHPWLDRHETSVTLRAYQNTFSYDDYDVRGNLTENYMKRTEGFNLSFSRPGSAHTYNAVTLAFRRDEYRRHDGEGINRSGDEYAEWRDRNFGRTNSVVVSHVADYRNDYTHPTFGSKYVYTVEAAGLGGDFSFQKLSADGQHYFPVGHAQTVKLRWAYGTSHGEMGEVNAYKLGGLNNLRGYREEQFKGNRMVFASAEYTFPLLKSVKGAVFSDWGSTWKNGAVPDGRDIHGSIGTGIIVDVPIGQLRIDYGYGEDGGRVHFLVGGNF